MKYTKKQLNAAISYWTKVLNESYGTLNEFKRNPSDDELEADIQKNLEKFRAMSSEERQAINDRIDLDIQFDKNNTYDCSKAFVNAARQSVGKVFDFNEKNLDDLLNVKAWTNIITHDPVLKPLLHAERDLLDIVDSLEEIDESLEEEEIRQGLLITFTRPSTSIGLVGVHDVDADNDDLDFSANKARALLDKIVSRLIELFRKHGLMIYVPDSIKFKAFFWIPDPDEDIMYLTVQFDTKPNEHNDSKPIEDEDFW